MAAGQTLKVARPIVLITLILRRWGWAAYDEGDRWWRSLSDEELARALAGRVLQV